MLGLTTGLMLYKPELSFGQISLLVLLVLSNSTIMASNQDKLIDFMVYGKELLQMSPHVHSIYGSLLNNGIYAVQP